MMKLFKSRFRTKHPELEAANLVDKVRLLQDKKPAPSADHNASPPVFVLVHGGGHGGWCWERVKTRLEQRGYPVYAPSLTGLGDRAGELDQHTDLQRHIQDIVDLIKHQQLTNVVLVGHSYGGMVITGVADAIAERLRHIVYLDAAHPKNGQSLIDAQPLIKLVPMASRPVVRNQVEVVLEPDDKVFKFLGLKKPEDIAFAKPHLTPHPWKSFTQKLTLSNTDKINQLPRTDIYTPATLFSEDPLGLKRRRQCDRLWIVKTGHDLMITEPEAVAFLLDRVGKL